MANPTASLTSVQPNNSTTTTNITVDNTGGCDAIYFFYLWEDSGTEREIDSVVDNSGTPQVAEYVGKITRDVSGTWIGAECWRIISPASVSSTWSASWVSGRADRGRTILAYRVTGGTVARYITSNSVSALTIGNIIYPTCNECLIIDAGLAGAVTANPTPAGSSRGITFNTQHSSGASGNDPFSSTITQSLDSYYEYPRWTFDAATSSVQLIIIIEPTSVPTPLALDTFQEDFLGSTLPASLIETYTNNAVVVTPGDSFLYFSSLGSGSVITLITSELFYLGDSQIEFDVASDADVTFVDVGFYIQLVNLQNNDYSLIMIELYNEDLHVYSNHFGTLANFTYDPVNHKRLRIREDSGTLYVEASPLVTSWTTLYSGPTISLSFNLSLPVRIEFGVYVYSSIANDVMIDKINLPYSSAIQETISGTFTSNGSISRVVSINLNGLLFLVGTLLTRIYKILIGLLSFIGVLVTGKKVILDGIIDFSSSLQRNVKRSLSGILTFIGELDLPGIKYQTLFGILSSSGLLIKKFGKTVAGSISFVGQLFSSLNPIGAITMLADLFWFRRRHH